MAFKLAKGSPTSTVPMERFIANGAVAANMPVALTAGATGAELGKVTQLTGGASATEVIYGVANHAADSGAEVLVIPLRDGQVWEVDTAADTNVTNVGADNYLASTTLLLTVGGSSLNGRKCEIIGQLGVTGARKYLVKLDNFGVTAAQVVAYTLDKTGEAFNSAAVTIFTAPFAMRVDDIIVTATVTEGSGVVTVTKGTAEICNAIACATDGAVSHMSAGATAVRKANAVLAAGDVVKVISSGGTAANIRGIVTVLGHRI